MKSNGDKNESSLPVRDERCFSCTGLTIFTSTMKAEGKRPVCLGFKRSMNYIIKNPVENIDQEPQRNSEFLSACLGYSQTNGKMLKNNALPLCEFGVDFHRVWRKPASIEENDLMTREKDRRIQGRGLNPRFDAANNKLPPGQQQREMPEENYISRTANNNQNQNQAPNEIEGLHRNAAKIDSSNLGNDNKPNGLDTGDKATSFELSKLHETPAGRVLTGIGGQMQKNANYIRKQMSIEKAQSYTTSFVGALGTSISNTGRFAIKWAAYVSKGGDDSKR